MAEYIDDIGPYDQDALFSGTKATDYDYSVTNEIVWFSGTGTASTGFTLTDSPFIVFEVYEPDSYTNNLTGGNIVHGKKEFITEVGTIATTLSDWKTAYDAATPFTTNYKIKATHYKGSDLADVYFANKTEGFSLTGGTEEGVTDGAFTEHGSEWVMSDDLFSASVSSGAVYGTELVNDGAFTDTANWTEGTGGSVSGGTLTLTTNAADTTQSNVLTAGGGILYRCWFNISSVTTTGDIEILLGGYTKIIVYVDAPGDYYFDLISPETSANGIIYIGTTGFSGDMSNISIKEYVSGEQLGPDIMLNGTFTGGSSADWTLNGWSIVSEQLSMAGGTGQALGDLSVTPAIGDIYRMDIDIVSSSGADLRLFLDGNGLYVSAGDYTRPYTGVYYFKASNGTTANTNWYTGGGDVVVDNIVVRKVLS